MHSFPVNQTTVRFLLSLSKWRCIFCLCIFHFQRSCWVQLQEHYQRCSVRDKEHFRFDVPLSISISPTGFVRAGSIVAASLLIRTLLLPITISTVRLDLLIRSIDFKHERVILGESSTQNLITSACKPWFYNRNKIDTAEETCESSRARKGSRIEGGYWNNWKRLLQARMDGNGWTGIKNYKIYMTGFGHNETCRL